MLKELAHFVEPLKRRVGTAAGAGVLATDMPIWAQAVILITGLTGDLLLAHFSKPPAVK